MDIPWVIDEPTKVKHELLRRYIALWMKIFFDTNKKYNRPQLVIYFDGFCGPGEYFRDEAKNARSDGSPIIVAKIANQLIAEDRRREIAIVCIDKKKKCIDHLQELLDARNENRQFWKVYEGVFEERINEILDEVDNGKIKDYPMFFFIDPFGCSGFSIKTLKRIMAYPRSEIFINFMVYDIVRFWEQKHAENAMKDLFGSARYKEVERAKHSEGRQLFFLNLYCKNLNEIAGAKYVMPFRVNCPGQREKARPRYYLIHASQHIKALRVMKDNMARVSDSRYRFEAIGIQKDQMSLFEDPKAIDLRDHLISFIKENSGLDYDDLEDWAYANTSGVSSTIKESLIKLEKEEAIIICRLKRQRSNTVTQGATIYFQK